MVTSCCVAYYRRISVLSICVACKELVVCITKRQEKATEQIFGEYQAGCRKSRSVPDPIFTLREIIAEIQQCNLMVYALFVDLPGTRYSSKG